MVIITWVVHIEDGNDTPLPKVGDVFDVANDNATYLDVRVESVERVEDRP